MSTHWDLHANSRATVRSSFLSSQFFLRRTFLAMAWPTCPRCICLLSFTFDRAQMLNIGCWTFFACMLNIPPWLRENTHLDCRSLGRTKLTLREHLFKSGGSVTEGNLTFKGSLVTTHRFSFEFLYIGLININQPSSGYSLNGVKTMAIRIFLGWDNFRQSSGKHQQRFQMVKGGAGRPT